jgi:hypothetical protein
MLNHVTDICFICVCVTSYFWIFFVAIFISALLGKNFWLHACRPLHLIRLDVICIICKTSNFFHLKTLVMYVYEGFTSSIVYINRRNPCMLHEWSKIRIHSTKSLDLQPAKSGAIKKQA